jgi:ribosomal-protein-alanine N-acetyltransferase
MSEPVPGLDDAVAIGKLVFLRHPVEADRAEFVALRRDNREYLSKWEPIPPEGFNAYGDDAFDRELRLANQDAQQRLLICRISDGAIVGKLSLGDIVRGPAQFCHFGYWVAEPYTNKGFMTEGVTLGVEYAFETLDLHRVEANIQPHNEASRRVVAKCGFRNEGFSPRYIRIRGQWADHERWAITREEWADRNESARPAVDDSA